jgi:hypothetical protein
MGSQEDREDWGVCVVFVEWRVQESGKQSRKCLALMGRQMKAESAWHEWGSG